MMDERIPGVVTRGNIEEARYSKWNHKNIFKGGNYVNNFVIFENGEGRIGRMKKSSRPVPGLDGLVDYPGLEKVRTEQMGIGKV